MARKRKTMLQIRLILQKRSQGISIRSICRELSITRKAVRKYLRQSAASGLSLEELLCLSDEDLALHVIKKPVPATDDPRKQELLARFEDIKAGKELKRPGVTRKLLWEEYIKEYTCGYSYPQFCIHLNEWIGHKKVTAHFEHRPAHQLMVDFTGKKPGYIDKKAGEYIECEMFVAVLPCFSFTYAEVVATQQQPDFVKAIGNAFGYLGGVPQSVLCDNLRTAVKKSDRYKPSFTELVDQLSLY